jgi:hypothetical protein
MTSRLNVPVFCQSSWRQMGWKACAMREDEVCRFVDDSLFPGVQIAGL